MESLPGVRVDNFLRDLGREERDELRCRFKEAWLYVLLFLSTLTRCSSYALQGMQRLRSYQHGYRN